MTSENSTPVQSFDMLVHEMFATGWFEPLLFAVLLLAGLSILFYTLRTGVPPMPSNPMARGAMFRLIPGGAQPKTIYELGCGWGGIAFALAARFPDARVIAIELSPLPWAVCHVRRLFQPRPNLEIRRGDFLRTDLSGGDLLFCYLMVAPMTALERKLSAELRPGALVIANSFALPGWVPEKTEVVTEASYANIYRYRAPGR
ncbi:class I SAM-dependent methyltransferase [Nisaea acidiphila]|uniref:Class I SAM-dependent methyltransferase n=1 Tax=Nisaea acidiphila TaxID=1862145 RepID=A0A9J7ARQ4_9PROT|nr:class I SAM-dependent methyltransferase [Nisaea acidiphila]UUX49554.1 class I SAM-dependent methyltransferase [Nisaea acidiphila]